MKAIAWLERVSTWVAYKSEEITVVLCMVLLVVAALRVLFE